MRNKKSILQNVKYFIGILLLVCANIILFAHSVVPHHHHDGIGICINISSDGHTCCSGDGINNPHKHNCNQSEHHEDDCELNQALRKVFVSDSKPTFNAPVITLTIDSLVLSLIALELYPSSFVLFSYNLFFVKDYNSYCGLSHALRAPPVHHIV